MGALVLLSAGEAQRLTQDIKSAATVVRDGLFKLRNLVDEAKNSNVWNILGFASWTAYLSDTLASEPMRLGREQRQELVEYLSGEGLSTRAIAPIVGVHHDTVATDIKAAQAPVGNPTTEVDFDPTPTLARRDDDWSEPVTVNMATGEVIDAPVTTTETHTVKTVIGLDGKNYPQVAPLPPRRKALTDSAKDIGWELRKATEKLQRLVEDDRFSRNKEEVAAHIRGHLMFTVEVCQDLLDSLNQTPEA